VFAFKYLGLVRLAAAVLFSHTNLAPVTSPSQPAVFFLTTNQHRHQPPASRRRPLSLLLLFFSFFSSGSRGKEDINIVLYVTRLLIIHLFQLVFSAEIVFFSHNKSANSVFQPAYQHSRTAPMF
jgi:hypothetical protein